MTAQQFTEFFNATCRALVTNSKDGSLHNICMDWRHIGQLLDAGSANFNKLINICVWVSTTQVWAHSIAANMSSLPSLRTERLRIVTISNLAAMVATMGWEWGLSSTTERLDSIRRGPLDMGDGWT